MSLRKLVYALSMILGGCATCTVDPPVDGIDAETLAKNREQFKAYNLPYRLPRGCDAALRCALSADFNADGVDDFAALYEYAGPIRRGGRHLDLVILYSSSDSAQPRSVIFTHVGGLDGVYRTAVGLELQPPGRLELPTGSIRLERPAINLVDTARPDDPYLPTYYWLDDKFQSISKADD